MYNFIQRLKGIKPTMSAQLFHVPLDIRCRFFHTPKGCRNGDKCDFVHTELKLCQECDNPVDEQHHSKCSFCFHEEKGDTPCQYPGCDNWSTKTDRAGIKQPLCQKCYRMGRYPPKECEECGIHLGCVKYWCCAKCNRQRKLDGEKKAEIKAKKENKEKYACSNETCTGSTYFEGEMCRHCQDAQDDHVLIECKLCLTKHTRARGCV